MAKKKVTHRPHVQNSQTNEVQDQNLTHQRHPPSPSSMEDPKEKLQNLKSLNDLLLKETFERRQQVETLMQVKEALESELARFGVEKTEMESELTRVSDRTVSLEIEKGLFCVFIQNQIGEMGVSIDGLVKEKRENESEIGLLKGEVNELMMKLESERGRLSEVCQERDMLRSDIDNWMKEANCLREKVIEMEKKERETEEETVRLKQHIGLLTQAGKERQNEIEELKKSMVLAQKDLVERVKENEDLNRKSKEIAREKNEIEMEKKGQRVRINELEEEERELKEIVLSLRKDEGVLCEKVMNLERNNVEAMEKEKAMATEINNLMEEKKEKERTIESLMEEIDSSKKCLDAVKIELNDKTELVEKFLREKRVIEEVMVKKENEISELHKEVGGLRNEVIALKESVKVQEDENKQLASEFSCYREAFEQVKLERDTSQKVLCEENEKVVNLRAEVLEMEKRFEETVAEFAKARSEHEILIKEKKGIQTQVDFLKEEKDLVERKLSEAQQEIDDLKTKMELASINSGRALTMLKNTAALMHQPNDVKDGVAITEKRLDNEVEPYAVELEVIKNAFRNKETAVEEMKQQVEVLQNYVAEARKKNGFWAVVSSAATVFAAASIAYVARVR